MHSYSTGENRHLVNAVAALTALAIAWLGHQFAQWISWPTWLLGSLSFAGALAALLAAFDQWVWRWQAARWLRLSVTPDLGGEYNGRLVSTFAGESGHRIEKQVRLTINQTWTRILVELEIDDQASRSRSIAASITQSPGGALIRYYYRNAHRPAIADDDMDDHDGAADLKWESHSGRLDGRYFTLRLTKGSLLLERQ